MNSKTHSIRAVAALAAVACAGGQEAQGQIRTEFRDSAGVRIVENSRPPEGSRLDWRIGTEPLLSIGRMEGEEPYLFGRIFGIEMLSDGRIVIGDDGTKELRVFDQQGNHLETWGGRGEGPGEFRGSQLFGMARLPGDSIIVWHFWYPELTVFGPDGGFVRRFIPERAQWDSWERLRHLVPTTVSRDGLILASQDILYMHPGLVEVWDAGGALRGSLGEHPGQEVIRHGGRDTDPVMFARYAFRRSWGDLFIGEETPTALVTVFDPEGRALGYFEIPEEMIVYEAGEDYILGKARDELGVETMHIWSLDRAGR